MAGGYCSAKSRFLNQLLGKQEHVLQFKKSATFRSLFQGMYKVDIKSKNSFQKWVRYPWNGEGDGGAVHNVQGSLLT